MNHEGHEDRLSLLGHGAAGRWRPFEARRRTAQPEVERSDSSP
jgi:hypothetical protein